MVLHIPACILYEVIIAGKIRCFLIVVFFLSCFESRAVPYEMNALVWRPSSGTLGSSVRLSTLAGHPPSPATITLTGWDGVSRGDKGGESHSQACLEPEQNGQLPGSPSIFSTILSLSPWHHGQCTQLAREGKTPRCRYVPILTILRGR